MTDFVKLIMHWGVYFVVFGVLQHFFGYSFKSFVLISIFLPILSYISGKFVCSMLVCIKKSRVLIAESRFYGKKQDPEIKRKKDYVNLKLHRIKIALSSIFLLLIATPIIMTGVYHLTGSILLAICVLMIHIVLEKIVTAIYDKHCWVDIFCYQIMYAEPKLDRHPKAQPEEIWVTNVRTVNAAPTIKELKRAGIYARTVNPTYTRRLLPGHGKKVPGHSAVLIGATNLYKFFEYFNR